MEMGPMRNQNFDFLVTRQCLVVKIDKGQQKNKNRPHQPTIKFTRLLLGWRQDKRNRSNQESKFDFLATHQCLAKIDEGTTKNKNRPRQPTIKFTRFLPISFLPLLAPPKVPTNQLINFLPLPAPPYME